MISTVEGEISNFQNRISQMAKVLQKFNGQVTEREELQKTIQTSAKEQIRQAEKIADEISFQGRNISFVTLLTVLFLPLGFFAQVRDPKTKVMSKSLMNFANYYKVL